MKWNVSSKHMGGTSSQRHHLFDRGVSLCESRVREASSDAPPLRYPCRKCIQKAKIELRDVAAAEEKTFWDDRNATLRRMIELAEDVPNADR